MTQDSCFLHGDYVDGVCPGCLARSGPMVVYVVRSHGGWLRAVYDTLEGAQGYANANFGPWFPDGAWERVASGADGTEIWQRMLFDEAAPDVDHEGASVEIFAVPFVGGGAS